MKLTPSRRSRSRLVALAVILSFAGCDPIPPEANLAVAPVAITSERIYVATGTAINAEYSNGLLRYQNPHGAISGLDPADCTTSSETPGEVVPMNAGGALTAPATATTPEVKVIFGHGMARGRNGDLFLAALYSTDDIAELGYDPLITPASVLHYGDVGVCNPGGEPCALARIEDLYAVGSITTVGTPDLTTVRRNIHGPTSTLDQPHAIAFAGNLLYVANSGRQGTTGRNIAIFLHHANGDAAPRCTLSTDNPLPVKEWPVSVYVDTADRLWVGMHDGQIKMWAGASTICSAGSGLLTTAPTLVFDLDASTFLHNLVYDDANHRLWVGDHTRWVYLYDLTDELDPGSPTCTAAAPCVITREARANVIYAVGGMHLNQGHLYLSVGSLDPFKPQAIHVYDDPVTEITGGTGPTRVICLETAGTAAAYFPPQPLVVDLNF